MVPLRLFTFVLIAASLKCPTAMGQTKPRPTSAQDLAFFETRVRPVLVKHCYACHSIESGKARGGLRVDSGPALRAGGDRGPAIVPGDPNASWLLKAIAHVDADLKMPPEQPALAATALADLRAWVEMGAPDPREEKSGKPAAPAYVRATRDFWAYRKPAMINVPDSGNEGWARRPLDHFILAGLTTKELKPSPDATPEVLLRRLHFDLVGLPPAPAAWESFHQRVKDSGLDPALEEEVDRLLSSPAYGEKWGRHWLDVARFGESSGGDANIAFPYAWRYRDYVIDAFNADVPFDRFLLEQIAGDLLPFADDAERARLLIATGFLAVGPRNLDEADIKQFRADLVDEQIDTVTRAVLSSSVACARCHDHKFDPFSMKDYYALAGVFTSTRTFFGTAVSPANRVGGDPLPLPRVPGFKVYHDSIPAAQVAKLKADLVGLRQEHKDRQAAAFKAASEGKNPESFFSITDALRIFWRSGAIEGQLEKVDDFGKALPLAMGVRDHERIGDSPLYIRGEVSRPAAKVARGFPEAIETSERPPIPATQSGRLELARWLTHPDHPLTGRVLVNRVWGHLFGAGLVRTVDNFGSTGDLPSHPELLDHLAVQFTQGRWSIKRLIRELVLSRTYRQASTFRAEAFERDPENRFLWRASKRRLPAEAIRDAMLSVSGELDPARPEASLVGRVIGDRPISLIGLDKRIPPDLDGVSHRSVYLPALRDRLPDVLELFDFAEPSLVTGQRETTNVPLQALYLMNSPFVTKQAVAFAKRLECTATSNDQRVELAFAACFNRPPSAAEKDRCLLFLERSNADAGTVARFCQALMCTAEFRNLD